MRSSLPLALKATGWPLKFEKAGTLYIYLRTVKRGVWKVKRCEEKYREVKRKEEEKLREVKRI